MVERIRCPKCGAINYGDVKKCWKCGAPLTPQGEQPPGAAPPPPPKPSLEETVPEKVPRIKYPILYPIGAVIFIVGVVLAVFLLYLVVDAPQELRSNYNDEHAVFAATQHFPVTVMGEVTAVSESPDEYGYYLYELDGDGVIKERVVSDSIQPDEDLIVRSKKPTLAKEGERVMWEVDKRSNDVGQDYLVVTDVKKPSLYRVPGVILAILGIALIVVGYVGIPDRSMLELMQGEGGSAPAPPIPPPLQPAEAPPSAQPVSGGYPEAPPGVPEGEIQTSIPSPPPAPEVPPEETTVEAEGGGVEETAGVPEPVGNDVSEGVPAAEPAEESGGEAEDEGEHVVHPGESQ